jgi:hypothetical protein
VVRGNDPLAFFKNLSNHGATAMPSKDSEGMTRIVRIHRESIPVYSYPELDRLLH